jgi:hypothetical protein
MRPDIYNALDVNLQPIVLEIEHAAGFEIQVLHKTEQTRQVTEEIVETQVVGAISNIRIN